MIREKDFVDALELKRVYDAKLKYLPIEVSNSTRPGLQLADYWDFFAYERPQLLGLVEMTYLSSLDESTRRARLTRLFNYKLPCIIICRGIPCFDEMLILAAAHRIPIYSTAKETTKFELELISYLNKCLAPHETRHGVLVNVFGTGLLSLGIYLPLLTVEPLLTYRFGRVQETVHKAVSKGLRITVGYALLLVLLGCVREWLSAGTVFGAAVGSRALLPMASMPAGGFIVLGVLCAVWRALAKKRREYLEKEARSLVAVNHQKEAEHGE